MGVGRRAIAVGACLLALGLAVAVSQGSSARLAGDQATARFDLLQRIDLPAPAAWRAGPVASFFAARKVAACPTLLQAHLVTGAAARNFQSGSSSIEDRTMIRSATWMVDRDWSTATKLPRVIHCEAITAPSPGKLVSAGVIHPAPLIVRRLTGFKTVVRVSHPTGGRAYTTTETYLMALGRTEVTLSATSAYSSLAGANRAAATRLKHELGMLVRIAQRSGMRD